MALPTETITVPLEDPNLPVHVLLTRVVKRQTGDGYSFSFVPVFKGAKTHEIRKVWLTFTTKTDWTEEDTAPQTTQQSMTETISVEGGLRLSLLPSANAGASAAKSNTFSTSIILLRTTKSQIRWKYRLHKGKGDPLGTGNVSGLEHTCSLKLASEVRVRVTVDIVGVGEVVGTSVFFSLGKKILVGAIGHPNAGKSTFVDLIAEACGFNGTLAHPSYKLPTTIQRVFPLSDLCPRLGGYPLTLVDTAGIHYDPDSPRAFALIQKLLCGLPDGLDLDLDSGNWEEAEIVGDNAIHRVLFVVSAMHLVNLVPKKSPVKVSSSWFWGDRYEMQEVDVLSFDLIKIQALSNFCHKIYLEMRHEYPTIIVTHCDWLRSCSLQVSDLHTTLKSYGVTDNSCSFIGKDCRFSKDDVIEKWTELPKIEPTCLNHLDHKEKFFEYQSNETLVPVLPVVEQLIASLGIRLSSIVSPQQHS